MTNFTRTKHSTRKFLRTKYPQKVNYRIGMVVSKLVDENKTNFVELAKICDVHVGRVVKWTRATVVDQYEVKPIVDKFGIVELDAGNVAQILIRLHAQTKSINKNVSRIEIDDIIGLSGKKRIDLRYIKAIHDFLNKNGYVFIKDGRKFYMTNFNYIASKRSSSLMKVK